MVVPLFQKIGHGNWTRRSNLVSFALGLFFGHVFTYLNLHSLHQRTELQKEKEPLQESVVLAPVATTATDAPIAPVAPVAPPALVAPTAPVAFLSGNNEPKDVKLLCWIMTGPANHWTKAIHVKRTWGKRCDKLLFMSSTYDSALPTIALTTAAEGRKYLWSKSREALTHVHKYYYDKFDWFMRADDDTFVVMENLRNFLKNKDPNEPIWFGSRFKNTMDGGPWGNYTYTFMTGGSGYIMSKETLRRFVEIGLPAKFCSERLTSEDDVLTGKCLHRLGVESGDTRDSSGRHTFLHWPLQAHMRPETATNYVRNVMTRQMYYPQTKGYPDCCSDKPISFHYVEADMMYIYDYLLNYGKYQQCGSEAIRG